MIWGPPGAGKSQIAYAVAKSLKAKMFELRANLFDPVDIRGGLKVVEMENGTYRTRYGVPEDYPDSDYQGLVMLFVDELPNATKATMNGFLQLLLDKKVGTYKLPPNTIIIAAGNRAIDRAAVHEMPTPCKTRFAHYELEPHIDDFVAWAGPNGIDESIIAFLRFRPALLIDIDPTVNAMPTPRAWEMLNRKLPFMVDEFYGCASLIGDGPAGEYIAFKRIYKDIPSYDDIIARPTTTKLPQTSSGCYAVCGMLSTRVTDKNFPAVIKYAKRLAPEYQVVVMRDCLAINRDLIKTDTFTKWTDENADVFL
jgi:hypothetical protein